MVFVWSSAKREILRICLTEIYERHRETGKPIRILLELSISANTIDRIQSPRIIPCLNTRRVLSWNQWQKLKLIPPPTAEPISRKLSVFLSDKERLKMEVNQNIVRALPALKVPNLSLGQYIYQQLREYGDNIIQVDIQTGKQFTYDQVLEKSVILATVLKSYGIQVEDRVSIASENHPNYVITMCATLFTGAAWAPLNPAYTKREYRHMLDIYQPRIMFVTHRTEKIMREIAPTLSWPMKLIQVEDVALDGQMVTLKELLEKQKNMVDPYAFEPVPVDDHAKRIAVILGSSGTTGFPKGVMLSHRNLLTFMFNTRVPAHLDCRPGDRVILFLPLFHGYAFGLAIISLSTGGVVYLMRNFELVALLKAIDDYRITHLPLVPPILIMLAKHRMVENYDFSSVRELLSGAAPLQQNVWEEVRRRTKMKYIRNGYGMTELSIISNLSGRRSTDNTVGAAIPGFQCKIVDPSTGRTLAVKEVGEVCFKGEQVMLGYFQNPKVTAKTIDQDNWCHTGDLGYLDEKGLLYITGRIKELIKYKGFQVSPTEIEAVILSHPSVKEVAVVGKPDEVSGEIPVAFVVRQPGSSTVSTKDIVDFANDLDGDNEISANDLIEVVRRLTLNGEDEYSSIDKAEAEHIARMVGKMRAHRLGKMLRQRYDKFLGKAHYGEVYAISTDFDRTKISLQLVLNGLYPPATNEARDQIHWSPVATLYYPSLLDTVLFSQLCPTYVKELQRVKKSAAIVKKLSEYNDLLEHLYKETGNSRDDPIMMVTTLYQLLVSQRSMNISLPEWATENVQKRMEEIVRLDFETQSYTTQMKRLNGGPIVKRFIENIRNKTDKTGPKIYLYSGHDLNIAGFAKANGFTEPKIPTYGSAIIVETLKSPLGVRFIRMYLWIGTTEELIPYKIPKCLQKYCPFELYVAYMQNVIPTNGESECLWNTMTMKHLQEYYKLLDY
ncbi:luciferin 4-monooxygenase isoform X2 [Osmia lignaria lignaria]|uniref:luciferin 4-monooxygenase isoform X2 n=1 Tax=Osmia lignaria lignaria TaxID=1437193 RepID=UPI00402B2D0C